jgi:tetratricopeptide (TPR) repeat protein
LAKKSEGLPLYIKKAVKMLKEKGFSLEVLNNLPYGAVYHNNKGIAQDELHKYQEAIEEFDKAIELNPNEPDYHNNKGLAQEKLNQYSKKL